MGLDDCKGSTLGVRCGGCSLGVIPRLITGTPPSRMCRFWCCKVGLLPQCVFWCDSALNRQRLRCRGKASFVDRVTRFV